MGKIEIRKAGPGDLEVLQQISRQTFFDTFAEVNTEENMRKYLEEGFSADKLSAELSNSDSAFYFAVLDNQVIGYMKLNTGEAQTEIRRENALEIERIYVLKTHQGQQVGQFLYEQAVALARQRQVDYIWLGVWEENLKAIRFYQKNGFKAFDKHLFRLGDDEQTDIMMKLVL